MKTFQTPCKNGQLPLLNFFFEFYADQTVSSLEGGQNILFLFSHGKLPSKINTTLSKQEC